MLMALYVQYMIDRDGFKVILHTASAGWRCTYGTIIIEIYIGFSKNVPSEFLLKKKVNSIVNLNDFFFLIMPICTDL